jgi:hypothetical protein
MPGWAQVEALISRECFHGASLWKVFPSGSRPDIFGIRVILRRPAPVEHAAIQVIDVRFNSRSLPGAGCYISRQRNELPSVRPERPADQSVLLIQCLDGPLFRTTQVSRISPSQASVRWVATPRGSNSHQDPQTGHAQFSDSDPLRGYVQKVRANTHSEHQDDESNHEHSKRHKSLLRAFAQRWSRSEQLTFLSVYH